MKNFSSKYFTLTAMLLLPILAAAQNAAPATPAANPHFWQNTIGIFAFFGGAVVLLLALYAVMRAFSIMAKTEELRILREKGVEEIVQTYRAPEESWWSRFTKISTKAVPVAQEQEIIFAHNYDGIHELDNKLPPWWLWLFYASILFAPVYWYTFHMSDMGLSSKKEYELSMKTAKAQVAAYVATQATSVDENTVSAMADANDLSLGKATFNANCVVCHGNGGEGNTVGPNLTDNMWINGCGIKNVFKTIKYGRVEKGMQSWDGQLRPIDIQRVASYVLTLSGSNPPNAKAPQGEACNPDAPVQQDSTDASVPAANQ